MHLYFLIHGLYGDKSHMESMRKILVERLPKNRAIVYCAKSNESFKTFDGVDIGGYRNYFELKKVVADNKITAISIIGYSMGGLYARYMIGLLEAEGFFDQVTPVNYVSVATPHLGTSFWKKSLWTRCINGFGRILLGSSGFDIMSRGPSGVLSKMTEPESPYINGLKRFENLILFANSINDLSVRFWTSFITDHHPFPRNIKQKADIAFYGGEENPYGPIFVDLAKSKLKGAPDTTGDSPVPLERKKTLNLAWLFLPLVVLVFSTTSIVSWVKYVFLKPRYSRLYLDQSRTADNHESSISVYNEAAFSSQGRTSNDFDQAQKGKNIGIGEELHVAVEELVPGSIEDSFNENGSVSVEKTSGRPEPASDISFVENGEKIQLTRAVRSRLNELNLLPWQKYVVYLPGHSHAQIIDRFDQGFNKGEQILRLLADKVAFE